MQLCENRVALFLPVVVRYRRKSTLFRAIGSRRQRHVGGICVDENDDADGSSNDDSSGDGDDGVDGRWE